MTEKNLMICDLCGHEWKSKLNRPLQCPRCKRYDFYKPEGEKEQNAESDSAQSSKSKEKGGKDK